MRDRYIPPKQGMLGQILDSAFILVLVYISLYIPLGLKKDAAEPQATVTAGEVIPEPVAEVATWESLGVSVVEQEQWSKLGYTAEQAAPIVNDRFDYTIDFTSLIITAAVILGYFIFLLRISDREYRQVIAEKYAKRE